MDAIYHARSCARRWGGVSDDYLPIHEWIDESAAHVNDFRHRAMRHHSLGVAEAVARFGRMLTNSAGREVPVKQIAERHIVEDLGRIPSVSDWIREMRSASWMRIKHVKKVRIA